MDGHRGFHGGFGNIWGQSRAQGVAPSHQAGQPHQGHEDKSLEEVYVFFLPIRESVIIDFFLVVYLRDKVPKIMPL